MVRMTPRSAFVYQEGLRGPPQPQAAVENLLLWDCYSVTFRFDAEDLIARYVDVAEPPPMAAMHRELAPQI